MSYAAELAKREYDEGDYGDHRRVYGTLEMNHAFPTGAREDLLFEAGLLPGKNRSLLECPIFTLEGSHPLTVSMASADFEKGGHRNKSEFVLNNPSHFALLQMDTMTIMDRGNLWIPGVFDCLAIAALSNAPLTDTGKLITGMHLGFSSFYSGKDIEKLLNPHQGATEILYFFFGTRMMPQHVEELANHPDPQIAQHTASRLQQIRMPEFHRRIIERILPEVKDPEIITTEETTDHLRIMDREKASKKPGFRHNKRKLKYPIFEENLILTTAKTEEKWGMITRRRKVIVGPLFPEEPQPRNGVGETYPGIKDPKSDSRKGKKNLHRKKKPRRKR